MAAAASRPAIWRWHFYAGLFVLPFILVLSVTGAIYLFKPQIERWEEQRWIGLGTVAAVSPDAQRDAALAAYPGARFEAYRLPREPGDAAMLVLGFPDGARRQVFVSPQGRVLGALDPEARIAETVARIHGSLMLGPVGDRLVELAASWTIVLILTGLWLWWPQPFRAGGTLYPRLRLRGRALLRDLHRVTGFWIAGLALAMLASGLPWAGTWGSAFKWVRSELGLVRGPEQWKVGSATAAPAHHGAAQPAAPGPASAGLPLALFVARAEAEQLAFPVIVRPPGAPQRFGSAASAEWSVASEAQNRPLARQVRYDPHTGREVSRRGFADQHPIDQLVNTGVAWHEGQLFGIANQLLGLLTAVALIAVSLLGVAMWWKRRPPGGFGAPPAHARPGRGAIAAGAALALLLPLFGLSLLAILAVDRLAQLRRATR